MNRAHYYRLPDYVRVPFDKLECKVFSVFDLKTGMETRFYLTPDDAHWIKDRKPDSHTTGIVLHQNSLDQGFVEVRPPSVRAFHVVCQRPLPPELIAACDGRQPNSFQSPVVPSPNDAMAPTLIKLPAPPVPEIDWDALVRGLELQGRPTRARLVAFMRSRETATGKDIAKFVHEDDDASSSAMWNNAKRTSDDLAIMGSRVSFRFVGGTMYRDISPK
jgi:hypothetical protein